MMGVETMYVPGGKKTTAPSTVVDPQSWPQRPPAVTALMIAAVSKKGKKTELA
jgi:hypothetical protein